MMKRMSSLSMNGKSRLNSVASLKKNQGTLSDTKRSFSKLPSTTIVQKATAAKASIILLRRSTTRLKAFVKMR